MKRLRVHDYGVMDTRLFLQLLALIFICHIQNTCSGEEELKNSTLHGLLESLEPLITYSERPARERKFFAAFGAPLPNLFIVIFRELRLQQGLHR